VTDRGARLWRTGEAAAYLGISDRSLRRAVRRRELAPAEWRRIPPGAVDCGLLALDRRERVVEANEVAARLLGLHRAPVDAASLARALAGAVGADGAPLAADAWPPRAALRSGARAEAIVGVGGGEAGRRWLRGCVRIRNAIGLWCASAGGGPGLMSPMPPAAPYTPRPTASGRGGADRPRTPSHSGVGDNGNGHAVRRGQSKSGPPRQRSQSRASGSSVA